MEIEKWIRGNPWVVAGFMGLIVGLCGNYLFPWEWLDRYFSSWERSLWIGAAAGFSAAFYAAWRVYPGYTPLGTAYLQASPLVLGACLMVLSKGGMAFAGALAFGFAIEVVMAVLLVIAIEP